RTALVLSASLRQHRRGGGLLRSHRSARFRAANATADARRVEVRSVYYSRCDSLLGIQLAISESGCSFFASFRFTSCHSLATIENRFVFRGVKSAAILCARSVPSSFAPVRRIAFAERSFRSSVQKCTLHIFHVSNACVSISSLASVFAAVRIAEAVSHV